MHNKFSMDAGAEKEADEFQEGGQIESLEGIQGCRKLTLNIMLGEEKKQDHEGNQIDILRHLPVSEHARFSTVSKSWYNLVKEPFFIDGYAPKLTGFFYQVKADDPKHNNHPRFAPVRPGTVQIPDPGLNFLRQKNVSSNIQVVDCCNGILLCTGSSVSRAGFLKTWFVCNPITMEKIALPYPAENPSKAIYALIAGLSNNGISEFKVLCVVKPKRCFPLPRLSILSSRTGVWEDVQISLPAISENASMGTKVFHNNMLFWDCFEGKILVTYLDCEDRKCPFELIDVPESPQGRFLCRMGDKIRCYCYDVLQKNPVWSISLKDSKNSVELEKENCIEFDNLSKDISQWLTMKDLTTPFGFRILAYAPESYELFVCFSRSIYSYDLRKREFNPILGNLFGPEKEHCSTTRIIPYLPNLASIQKWSCETDSAKEMFNTDSVEEMFSYLDILESATRMTRKRKMKKIKKR